MFEREHHRRIAHVLEALHAPLLEQSACLFGGGTAIALKYGEYRESLDIDFLTSDIGGYRALRQRLSGREGINALTRPNASLTQSRAVRADQYGIRTLLDAGGIDIKFEIVLEARIALEAPGATDRICGVATLTTLDMATSKLLANSDRWADDSAHSRDLIDLAMMAIDASMLQRAIDKAAAAYGRSIEADLNKAIDALKRRPGRLADCMSALQMTTAPSGIPPIPLAVVWKQIRRLVRRPRKPPPRR